MFSSYCPEAPDLGVAAWSIDPAAASGTLTLTAGTPVLAAVPYKPAAAVSALPGSVWYNVTTAGVGADSGTFLAVYNMAAIPGFAAGSLIAKTANLGAAVAASAAGGTFTALTYTAGVTALPQGWYWVYAVSNQATTQITLQATVAGKPNSGVSTVANYRAATNGSSITTAPATITPGSNTAATQLLCVGLA